MALEISSTSCPPNPPCPWLPDTGACHDHSITRRHGSSRGVEFYADALCYAQSQWIHRKPAQAILQLNKAWLADLTDHEEILAIHPPPYRALRWILRESADGHCGYLGNPVRHFQHLATRLTGSRAAVRSWRAWVCFHLAERILNPRAFPRDGRQLVREGLWIPSFGTALSAVGLQGWPGERGVIESETDPSAPGAG